MFEFFLAAALNLQGTWTKSCQLTQGGSGQIEALHVEGDLWTRATSVSNDPLCRGGHFLVIRHQTTSQIDNLELNLITLKMTYQPLTAGQAAWMKASEFCGIDTWESEVEVDVTGLTCQGFQMPAHGDIAYSRIELGTGTTESFRLGKRSAGFDGTNPEKRFRELESLPFAKLQP